MRTALRRAWAEHRALTLAVALALVLVAAMAVRVTASWVYWSSMRGAEIASWMTVGVAARTQGVDRRALFEMLEGELGLVRGAPEPIAEIAARTGLSEAEVTAAVEAGIARLRAGGSG